MKIVGSLAYIASGPNGIRIVDIHDPSKPVLIGALEMPSVWAIDVAGSYAYLGCDLGVRVLDVSQPSHPIQIGNYQDFSQVKGIRVVDSVAYAAASPTGLQILDVNNPASPAFLGQVPSRGSGTVGVEVFGSIAYMADDRAGLQVASVSNPRQPTRLESSIQSRVFSESICSMTWLCYPHTTESMPRDRKWRSLT
jgi:hypothetical protein